MGDRFLEKSGGLLRAGVLIKTRYAHIHRGEGNYPTRLMCRCLEVSHSGYYAWRNSGMTETPKRREELAIFVTYSSHKTKSCHWAASPESPPMDKTPSQSQVRLYFHLATGKGFCLKSAIFLQRLQTNPPVIDGSTKPWNAGGVATSPERVRRLMQPGGPGGGVSPAPRPTTTVPAANLTGRPNLIGQEASRLMLQFRELVGDHHPYTSHPGRIRVPGRP